MIAQEMERGAASLMVTLEDGRLIVTHGTDGVTLLEGPLPAGGWDTLVRTLRTIAPEAEGLLARF